MVTLHPQPAMEHLHHRFLAADGAGSDAMIAFEATEVGVDPPLADARPGPARRSRWPARRIARPIPLADNVTGGVAAVQASAGRARTPRPAACSPGCVRGSRTCCRTGGRRTDG